MRKFSKIYWFKDQYGRAWSRDIADPTRWLCQHETRPPKSAKLARRTVHTDAEAQQARESAIASRKCHKLIGDIYVWLLDKGGCVGGSTVTRILAVFDGNPLYIYGHVDTQALSMADRWEQAGGYSHRAETLSGFIDWLSSLSLTEQPTQP
jgi:hypothetical protein